ncbi:unnamed protein product [Ilex paraguariensis]|uniref:Autophagy-related protein 18g n=1 Tax=Ilex paraguariensis TaxID=185542 RepID=A0ABC8U271_9AQUA
MWAGFDKLELGPVAFRHVLLLGYQNGFQVIDVEDASNFSELVSKHEDPVTFLQMLPIPAKYDGNEGFRSSHPLLLVVTRDDKNRSSLGQNHSHLGGYGRDGIMGSPSGSAINSPTAVRFYSLRTNCYMQVLRFRSAVLMVRCSPRMVALGLEMQIYCIDALTLENKFSVLTYPIPQFGGQGMVGVNIGYGPMALGSRWLAYVSNNPLVSNTGRLCPKNLTPSGLGPSTSPGSGSLVARYAMASSKQLAAGIINLGDVGYKKLSKYCPELLLADGPSSPGRKVGRPAASEIENAGMVVVKDVDSGAIISQFRAHTSPISALCFDPSGTLLVTASVHGNSVNIFRIMPSRKRTDNISDDQTYDWSSSHVHLYKLYRGMTTAIIQDISFSNYSQWIAIVSSKGTCHIFVLSPFGGDTSFQTLNYHDEVPSPCPAVSLPWWSTSSFTINQKLSPPPAPVTLSVVSRIKNNNSGLLNSVSNAATSAAGKVSMPSGAVAAVFHNSISWGFQEVGCRVNSLEHLLVYTPSGFVIQHELMPLIGAELSESRSKIRSTSYVHLQDEELRVKVEPVQWWDVCRPSDSPEREEGFSGNTFDSQEAGGITDSYRTNFPEINHSVMEKRLVKSDSVKPPDRSHLHLSSAEVQINSGRLPIWQKSKIHFYTMIPPRVDGYTGGEFEIEKVPFYIVEIRRKDLLPVFDHFHSIKSGWNDRGPSRERYPNASSLETDQARDKVTEETVICHSKPASLSSTESSDGGSSRRIENLLDFDQLNTERSITPTSHSLELHEERKGSTNLEPPMVNQKSTTIVPLPSKHTQNANSHVDHSMANGSSLLESTLPSCRRLKVKEAPISNPDGGNYCKVAEFNGCCKLTEVETDDVERSGSLGEWEKPQDDREDGGLLGDMF